MEKGSNANGKKVVANSSSKVEKFFEDSKKALGLKEGTSIDWVENSGRERILESSDSGKTLRDCNVDSGRTLYYVVKHK
ncbi:hypothetical protein H4R99_005494 [Coemansia sp. RSA 1722]|nr:hypothetical protein H4R99_005494 [Coemansia sp. RSA 1722]